MNQQIDKKKFTDLFINRPVLASVVSLLILLLGLRSMMMLPVQQYPTTNSALITISTAYPGANASVVQGFITSLIAQAVGGADGVDYTSSISQQNSSSVSVFVRMDADPDKAMTSVLSKVSAIQGQLPRESEQPSITKQTSDQTGLMYISFTAPDLSREQLYDYLSRAVQPVLETQPGVASANILGGTDSSMRIWLDPNKMAGLNVTADDVAATLQNNNYQSTAGSLRGKYVEFTINAKTLGVSPDDFRNMVIRRGKDGSQITIGDVSDNVAMGPENQDISVSYNGKPALFIGIFPAPEANPLTISTAIKKVMPDVESSLPQGITASITYDATDYIRSSIDEVLWTILEASLIVMFIIYLFLGSLRTVLVPVVTIPLSLVGVCSLMLAMGFSLNLLTLLALVLAIGMVVDDAIVVVENIYRHIEEGMSPYDAAIVGTREIAMPVISMSLTLAAVFAPIGFMGGLTGNLFREFAFTLAAAVILSGVIALTLSPMMCSKILNKDLGKGRFVHALDVLFNRIRNSYEKMLSASLYYRPVTIVFCILVLVLSAAFLLTTGKELAPLEDRGFFITVGSAPNYANIDYTERYSKQLYDIYKQFPFTRDVFTINGLSFGNPDVTSSFTGLVLKDWSERKTSTQQAQMMAQKEINNITGVRSFAVQLPSLPGASGYPIQFVITSLGDFKQLVAAAQDVQRKAMESGKFIFLSTDANYTKPDLEMHIDRKKAADLGISMNQIGSSLAGLYGENFINRFNLQGQSYKVIPLLSRQYRYDPDSFNKIYLRTAEGQLVPLSSIVKVDITTQPNAIYQYQQLNAVTLQGMMKPPETIDSALNFLRTTLKANYPTGYGVGYSGESRQFIQEGGGLTETFLLAMIIIFLVLAAQFESFRDPLIILISVPLSTFGALLFLNIGFATLNIYTEIGLITLIGLISKHGILMTEFANQLQISEKLSIRDAIIKSAGIRLRPILMTTAAMVFGVLPLLIATGPGAKSRFDIGLVIFTGMIIGTCFTLFVVPMVYSFLAKRHMELKG